MFPCFILVILLHSACGNRLPQNVFEEIYNTYSSPNTVKTEFSNVLSLSHNIFQVPKDIIGNERGYELYLTYDKGLTEKPYLRKDTAVYLILDPENKTAEWNCKINFSGDPLDIENGNGEELHFSFLYDVRKQQLTTQPVSAQSEILNGKHINKYCGAESRSGEYIKEFCELHNISRQNIEEYKTYFLNDVIIGFWIDGNSDSSRFSAEDTGAYKTADEFWSLAGE